MKNYRFFNLILIFNITFLLVSDVTAGKIISLFGYPATASTLLFPVVYIISDIMTEVYGYAAARRMLWYTIAASFMAGIAYQLAVFMPPAHGFDNNDAYTTVLGSVPRIMLVGWIAVFFGDVTNNYILAKMKIWSRGKYLWARTISSTFLGQIVNSLIFYVAALYGTIPFDLLINAMLFSIVAKTFIEILMTPVTCIVIGKLKKIENTDHYDDQTNFNPFRLKG